MGYTLVDITQTGDVSSINSTARNQQRNWETLLQVLGLRVQIITMSVPEVLTLDVTNSKFGSSYTGQQAVWTFKFGVEQDGVFANSTRPFGTLESDFVNVPIITGLTETATISTPMFIVSGADSNIYFEPISI
jgi:hypothetical protein